MRCIWQIGRWSGSREFPRLVPISDQIELIVLTDEVDAEAVVRRFVDESETGSKIKMASRDERIIGPQHQSAVPGGTREVDALGDQAAPQPVATAVAGDQQDTELGCFVVLAYAEHATDTIPVDFGQPRRSRLGS